MSALYMKLALILGAFVAVVLATVSSMAFAQGEDEDAAPAKKVTRRYPGGGDEQPLTVQSTLALSTRYPDQPRPTPSSGASANDEASHD